VPADRSLADGAGDDITGIYQRLRALLAVRLANMLKRSLTGRHDSEMRTTAQRLLAALEGRLPQLAEQAMRTAHERGRAEAERELSQLRRNLMRQPTRVEVSGRVFELAQALRATHPRVVAWAEQSYRAVVIAASNAEGGTRLQQAQRAWSQLLDKGITGYTDISGRRWSLESYVEMATRSRLADTAVNAHLDRLATAGLDLVIVSDAPGECKLCRPLEAKILSRGIGGARTVQMEHATTDDRMVSVRVWGSVGEARAAGLMHPGCRHSLAAYLPGLTKVPTKTADPQGDAARQRLRALERHVRAWKLRADAALTPEAGRAASARVRAYQDLIRDHTSKTGLIRQPKRELIGQAR
jgi:hypothetical protein